MMNNSLAKLRFLNHQQALGITLEGSHPISKHSNVAVGSTIRSDPGEGGVVSKMFTLFQRTRLGMNLRANKQEKPCFHFR